jgi:hypothetical protein
MLTTLCSLQEVRWQMEGKHKTIRPQMSIRHFHLNQVQRLVELPFAP